MMNDCLFCSIANGDKSKLVWSNDVAAAFEDINPKAPVHVLVVTKKHYKGLNGIDDQNIAGRHLLAAKEVAKHVGIGDNFRLVINTGPHTGMMEHFHIHVLGGKPLDDYPRDPDE